jgi:alpha-D-xyloside xylohydrolase
MEASCGAPQPSGADNEVWSYSEEVYEVCKKYLRLREELKPYIKTLMQAAHEKGAPVMRPLFYDFPEDPQAWTVEDQYMFGPDYLVAPVLYPGLRERQVYLPKNTAWKRLDSFDSETVYQGGERYTVPAPLDDIPVFSICKHV